MSLWLPFSFFFCCKYLLIYITQNIVMPVVCFQQHYTTVLLTVLFMIYFPCPPSLSVPISFPLFPCLTVRLNHTLLLIKNQQTSAKCAIISYILTAE